MKRILIMFIGVLLIVGCSKETNNQILGTWALVEYTAINVRTGECLKAETDVKTWTFTKGGSAYVNGSTPLTYTINGKYLTTKYLKTGREIVYEIVELSKSKLKVYWYAAPGKYQDGTDMWYTFTKMKD